MRPLLKDSFIAFTLAGLLQGAAGATDPHGSSLPTAAEYSATLLPERSDVVSWKTLSDVKPLTQDGRIVPQFSKQVLDLDKREIRVQGFMFPIETKPKHQHFVLLAVPTSCPFCMPAGPEAIVEVRAKAPMNMDFKPVVLSGKFSVRGDDPRGIFYVLTEAVLIETPANSQ